MHRVLIVIVLYRQLLEKSAAYRSLKSNLDSCDLGCEFFVYDNSPAPQATSEKLRYIRDVNNSGVSCAYNQAAQYARENGFAWMLLSDQDTNYPSDILKKYVHVIKNHPDIKLIAPKARTHNGVLLSPCRYIHKRGKCLQSIASGKLLMNGLSVINSGMMVNVATFISAGGYNENVPLDLSDHQFIERYKRKERFFWVLDAEVLQDFSNEEASADALYSRFRMYVNAIKNCERTSFMDSIDYFTLAFGRAIKLTLRTKQVRFIKHFMAAYLCSHDSKKHKLKNLSI